MTLQKQIAVMQAFADGKEVEVKPLQAGEWIPCPYPVWNFANCAYRVKVAKPSINWNHVADEYRYLAIDSDGRGHLYTHKPYFKSAHARQWSYAEGKHTECLGFESFRTGSCVWYESLIERPEGLFGPDER